MPSTLAVVNGAILRCDKGAAPTPLVATTAPLVQINARAVATIIDKEPAVNVLPFGVCAITLAPCVPITPLPWMPGGIGIPVATPFPVLTKASLLPCMIGGIIEVLDAGQTSVVVDAPTVAKADVQSFVANANALANSGYSFSLSQFVKSAAWKFATGKLEYNFSLVDEILTEQALHSRQTADKLPLGKQAKHVQDALSSEYWARFPRGLAQGAGIAGDALDYYKIVGELEKRNYEKAGVEALGTVAGGVAYGVCTGVVTAGTVGVGAVPAVAGCGIVGVGVSEGAKWGYNNAARPAAIYAYDRAGNAASYAYHRAGDAAGAVGAVDDKVIEVADDWQAGVQYIRDDPRGAARDVAEGAEEAGRATGRGVERGGKWIWKNKNPGGWF